MQRAPFQIGRDGAPSPSAPTPLAFAPPREICSYRLKRNTRATLPPMLNCPIFDFQILNALELIHIISDENQIPATRDRGNHQVIWPDNVAHLF